MAAATTCRDAAARIHDYVDHTLPLPQRRGVADHLAVCPDCRLTEREIRCLLHLLRRMSPRSAPPPMKSRLLASLHHPAPPQPRR